jgi:hypothetical protein
VWEIIAEAVEGVEREQEGGGKVGLTGKTARDIGEMAVRVAGDYVCESEIIVRLPSHPYPTDSHYFRI